MAGDIPPRVENSLPAMKSSASELSAGMERQSKSLRSSGEGPINERVDRSLDGVSSLDIKKKWNV
jgi:hypothetical protein